MASFKQVPVQEPASVVSPETIMSFVQNPEVAIPAALLGGAALVVLMRTALQPRQRPLRRLDDVLPYARPDD